MSAEKRESPTWEWIEREIVDYVLIAGKEPSTPKAFLNRLAMASEPASPSQTSMATQRRSTSDA